MNIQAWWIAVRPKTLIVSIAPVFLGVALAYNDNPNQVNWIIGLLTLIAAVLIQIGTNLVNDVYDFIKGADNHDRLGPMRVTQSGLLSEKKVKKGAFLCFFLALLIGIYLVYQGGLIILLIGSFALISGYCYTAGPYPLAYNGLGDLFVFIFFGLIAVPGTYYLQSGILFSTESILIGSAIGFIAVAILCINNIRDIESDKKVGKKTLAVRFGKKPIIFLYDLMILLPYICIGILFFNKNGLFFFDLTLYLLLLSVPVAISLIIDIHNKQNKELNNILIRTALFMRIYFMLLIIGIVL
tara:strand:- start:3202 stop:4095 length:894 start_codon:yes stop_codon:yes gene_type:complete